MPTKSKPQASRTRISVFRGKGLRNTKGIIVKVVENTSSKLNGLNKLSNLSKLKDNTNKLVTIKPLAKPLVRGVAKVEVRNIGGEKNMENIIQKNVEELLSNPRYQLDENGMLRVRSRRSSMIFKEMLKEEGNERD